MILIMRICIVISLAALCASCATPEPVPVLKPICLPMVEYSAAEQAQAASEMERLGPNSELAKFVTDYGKMRAADRACLGKPN